MKIQKIGILMLIAFLMLSTMGSCFALDVAKPTTYFRAEGINNLSNNAEINMISNNVTINIEKEKVTNQFILQNATNATKSFTFSIPLENTQAGTRAENVQIKINNTQVQPKIEELNGKIYYTIATKMTAGEYKKIYIEYTSPNMSTAPKIEYELENLGIEKICKKLQVKIIVPEKDVPLVTKIKPANYTFEDDIITYNYTNVNLTDLNRYFVLEKEIYEDEVVLEKQVKGEFERTKVFGLSREDFLQQVKTLVDTNFHTWIRDGIRLNMQDVNTTSQIIDNILNDNKISSTYTYLDGTGKEQAAKYEVGNTYTKLFNYVILRQWIRENRQDYIAQYFNNIQESKNGILDVFKGQPLTLEYVRQNSELEGLILKNLIVVVDIPNIQTQVYQEIASQTTGNTISASQLQPTTLVNLYEQVQKDNTIEKIVYIPGNSTLSEEKRAEFANSIGADIYIRLQVKELEEQKNNILRDSLAIPFMVINEWNANFESGKTVVLLNKESSYQNSTASIKQMVEQSANAILQNKQNIELQKRRVEDELNNIDKNLQPEQIINVEDVIPNEEEQQVQKGGTNILTIILIVIVIGIVLCITLIAIGMFRKNH